MAAESLGEIIYNKDKVLGSGSRGTIIYEGTFNGKPVAVKVLKDFLKSTPDIIRNVKRLTQLENHDNVISYLDAVEAGSEVLIALEKCSTNLDLWLDTPRPEAVSLHLTRQITCGISYLHGLNLIHGDLKPSNILIIDHNGEKPVAKISDFEFPKKVSSETRDLSNGSFMLGTAGWMAPEILKAIEIYDEGHGYDDIKQTMQSDVFSLGCVLYYVLVTKRHPFGSKLRRDANIIDYRPKLWQVDLTDNVKPFIYLISLLIAQNPRDRPTAMQTENHFLFWSVDVKYRFLRTLCKYLRNKTENRILETYLIDNLKICKQANSSNEPENQNVEKAQNITKTLTAMILQDEKPNSEEDIICNFEENYSLCMYAILISMVKQYCNDSIPEDCCTIEQRNMAHQTLNYLRSNCGLETSTNIHNPDEQTEESSRTVETMIFQGANFIIEIDIPVTEVMEIMSDLEIGSFLFYSWRHLAGKLGTPHYIVEELGMELKQCKIDFEDLFEKLLVIWCKREQKYATVGRLTKVFCDGDWKSLADVLLQFFDPTSMVKPEQEINSA